MTLAIDLLFILGLLGAADTLYFHEWRARLPLLGRAAAPELRLHAMRDFVYAALFATLPWLQFRGAWIALLASLLAIEIVLTLWDFVVEDRVRKPLGGVHPGERVMHAVMGIVYGAMLASLWPALREWAGTPTTLLVSLAEVHPVILGLMALMAVGVFLSGLRDLCAAYELPGSSWPWRPRIRGDSQLHVKCD